MRVLNQAFDQPMELEERAADPLAGGMMGGYQCGMTWGAALAAGAQVYRLFGAGPQAQARAVVAAQRVVESFRTQNRSINCREITGIDLSSPKTWAITRFLIKSAPTGSCFGMAARYAPIALREINAALSEESAKAPSAPVSCSAMLAQKMGLSDRQTIMAAGLAGGIGLSGGTCGALGTTVWIISMTGDREDAGKVGLVDPRVSAVITRFAEYAGDRLECSEIVGRRFESVDDHADYLRSGGCSRIIEGLATQKT